MQGHKTKSYYMFHCFFIIGKFIILFEGKSPLFYYVHVTRNL